MVSASWRTSFSACPFARSDKSSYSPSRAKTKDKSRKIACPIRHVWLKPEANQAWTSPPRGDEFQFHRAGSKLQRCRRCLPCVRRCRVGTTVSTSSARCSSPSEGALTLRRSEQPRAGCARAGVPMANCRRLGCEPSPAHHSGPPLQEPGALEHGPKVWGRAQCGHQ